jgi:IS30 family transposase
MRFSGQLRRVQHPISVSHTMTVTCACSGDGHAITLWRQLPQHRARPSTFYEAPSFRVFQSWRRHFQLADFVAAGRQLGHDNATPAFRKKYEKAIVRSLVELSADLQFSAQE